MKVYSCGTLVHVVWFTDQTRATEDQLQKDHHIGNRVKMVAKGPVRYWTHSSDTIFS